MNDSSHIAEVLGERDPVPLAQIAAIVEAVGTVEALGLLAQTERIEKSGGMLVPDGSRKRTRGGIFFALARATLTAAQRRKIFAPTYGSSGSSSDVAPSSGASDAMARAVGSVQNLVRLPRRDANGASSPPPAADVRSKAVPVEAKPSPIGPDQVMAQIERLLDGVEAISRGALEKRIAERYGHREEKAAPHISSAAIDALEARVRHWMVASVAARVGTSRGDLATEIYGSDTPANRQKVGTLQKMTLRDVLATIDSSAKSR